MNCVCRIILYKNCKIYFHVVCEGGEFNTQVDIILNQWAEQQLPQISVDAGWETLQKEFKALIQPKPNQKNPDDIFDSLKLAVLDELLKRHKWEEKVGIVFH